MYVFGFVMPMEEFDAKCGEIAELVNHLHAGGLTARSETPSPQTGWSPYE
jgi:hypothetical protein